jgi:L-phenylalanine/L-methionine N-acetyltransferase
MMGPRGAQVVVRRADVGDAEAIARTFETPKAIAGTLQLPYPSVDVWRKRLAEAAADDYVLVAVARGKIIGHAGLHAASRSPRRRHAATLGMVVRDDWHRRGVGSVLLDALLDLADNWLGYTRVELTVYTDNAAALALYRRFGFAVEGTHRGYALRDGRYVDAYAMARLRAPRAIAAAKPARTRRKRSA